MLIIVIITFQKLFKDDEMAGLTSILKKMDVMCDLRQK